MNVLVKEGILSAILLIMSVFDRLYIDWHWVYTLVLYPACGALVCWIVNLFL